MTDAKSAWNEAGDRLQSLGASLKQHYAAQRGEEAEPAKEQVSDAFKKVGDALQGAFDALGAAAKDPAVKEDVRATGKSVAEALGQTFNSLSGEVKKAFDQRKGEPEPPPAQHWDPPATSPSTAAPAGAQDSGVDGGTAPRPAATPDGEQPAASPQDRQDPGANI